MNEIFRVKGGECVTATHVKGWGERMVRVPDPDVRPAPYAGIKLTLAPEHRLRGACYSAWVDRAFELCREGSGETREVGVMLLRSAQPPHADWRILVPRQTVGGAALAYDFGEWRDILTGEAGSGVPQGWMHVGTSHSHNEMQAFFSSTDDRDERSIPGAHVVIGKISKKTGKYVLASRVCDRGEFFPLPHDVLVDTSYVRGSTFHASCLTMIDERAEVVFSENQASVSHGDGRVDGAWEAWWDKYGGDESKYKSKKSKGKPVESPRPDRWSLHTNSWEDLVLDSIADDARALNGVACLLAIGLLEARMKELRSNEKPAVVVGETRPRFAPESPQW